jgi:hypothetical protein
MKDRITAFFLWVLCALALPILCIMQLLQGVCGDVRRSKSMAVAIDSCANALFGGLPNDTISARTGRGVMKGYKWAVRVAPIIDFFFGRNHCMIEAIKSKVKD